MLDVAATVREFDRDAFRQIFPGSGGAVSSPANRILLPGPGSARPALTELLMKYGVDHPSFASHLIDHTCAVALHDNDSAAFVAMRSTALTAAVDAMAERLAEWGRNDRPSIDYILSLDGEP